MTDKLINYKNNNNIMSRWRARDGGGGGYNNNKKCLIRNGKINLSKEKKYNIYIKITSVEF